MVQNKKHFYEIDLKQGDLQIQLISDDLYFISKQMERWFELLLDDSYKPIAVPPGLPEVTPPQPEIQQPIPQQAPSKTGTPAPPAAALQSAAETPPTGISSQREQELVEQIKQLQVQIQALAQQTLAAQQPATSTPPVQQVPQALSPQPVEASLLSQAATTEAPTTPQLAAPLQSVDLPQLKETWLPPLSQQPASQQESEVDLFSSPAHGDMTSNFDTFQPAQREEESIPISFEQPVNNAAIPVEKRSQMPEQQPTEMLTGPATEAQNPIFQQPVDNSGERAVPSMQPISTMDAPAQQSGDDLDLLLDSLMADLENKTPSEATLARPTTEPTSEFSLEPDIPPAADKENTAPDPFEQDLLDIFSKEASPRKTPAAEEVKDSTPPFSQANPDTLGHQVSLFDEESVAQESSTEAFTEDHPFDDTPESVVSDDVTQAKPDFEQELLEALGQVESNTSDTTLEEEMANTLLLAAPAPDNATQDEEPDFEQLLTESLTSAEAETSLVEPTATVEETGILQEPPVNPEPEFDPARITSLDGDEEVSETVSINEENDEESVFPKIDTLVDDPEFEEDLTELIKAIEEDEESLDMPLRTKSPSAPPPEVPETLPDTEASSPPSTTGLRFDDELEDLFNNAPTPKQTTNKSSSSPPQPSMAETSVNNEQYEAPKVDYDFGIPPPPPPSDPAIKSLSLETLQLDLLDPKSYQSPFPPLEEADVEEIIAPTPKGKKQKDSKKAPPKPEPEAFTSIEDELHIETLLELCELAPNTTSGQDYLILSAYFLSYYKRTDKYALKDLNAQLLRSGLTPVNHSILESAISGNLVKLVPDLTGTAHAAEYCLTPEGFDYAKKLINL